VLLEEVSDEDTMVLVPIVVGWAVKDCVVDKEIRTLLGTAPTYRFPTLALLEKMQFGI